MYHTEYNKAHEVQQKQRLERLEQQHKKKLDALQSEKAVLAKQHEIDKEFVNDFQRYVESKAEKGIEPHRIEYKCDDKPSLEALECINTSNLQFVATYTKQPPRLAYEDESEYAGCRLPTYTVKARSSWLGWFETSF